MMSATVPDGFLTVIMTPVFGPGAGEMTPVILMGWAPEYEGASVWSVIVYVAAACTGVNACAKRQMSVRAPKMRKAIFERAIVSGSGVFSPGI